MHYFQGFKAKAIMTRKTKKRSVKSGLPPGTLMHIGDKLADTPEIIYIEYADEHCIDKKNIDLNHLPETKEEIVQWLNIDGLHDVESIEKIGKKYGIHNLALEDILNTDQRPKSEEFEDYNFVALKMLIWNKNLKEIESEQVSLIQKANFLVSFQEKKGNCLEPIIKRLKEGKGRIRKAGQDYLLYAIIDTIIDNYFLLVEELEYEIELIEDEVLKNPNNGTLQKIEKLRRELIYLRKMIWPTREMINNLLRNESGLMSNNTKLYMRDVYDHSIQVIESIDTFRETLTGLMDIYLSSVSNKMNSVMKTLTVFTTIFMPLTFIVGVYGMNFDYMPELHYKLAYPVTIGVMILIAGIMFIYFKMKDWF